MKIFFYFFFSFWGVLGKRTLNLEVLKCHEDRITLDTYVQQGKTMDNKSYIYVKTSLAKWGPGGGGGLFNIQTGPILVHIYPPFNNNLHVKYRSNLIRTFWVKIKNMKKIISGSCFCPYIKSRGTRGTKMSANADLITVETYLQQGETIWKPFFHLWAKMWNKFIFWGYFGGPEGVFNDQTKPILLSSYPLTHIYVHVI